MHSHDGPPPSKMRDVVVNSFEPKPLKVHWKKNEGGAMCRTQNNALGRSALYANKVKEVTCKVCARMLADIEGRVALCNPDLERQLDDEITHADFLAEALVLLFKWIDEDQKHIIAIAGSQITIGQVIDGVLALHEKHRKEMPNV